nr:aminopeptidase [Oleiagrimonas sp. C23AA]
MLLTLSGCSTLGYYAHLASGEMGVLRRRQPIHKVIAQADTPPALRARLAAVLKARAFASDHLHLPRNRSYTLYAQLDRPFVMYNVFATPALSLAPVTHCFAFAGCVAYQGFYQLKRAQAAAARLRAKGDDVYIGGVPAYSTLGHFADPVLSTMNRWSRDELIGTVFHELAHQKLYLKGDTAFNESFATFVQHEGLREWHAAQGTPLEQPAEAAHGKAITQLILRTRKRLASLYASAASEAQKRAGKARAFDDMRQQFQALKKQWHGKDAGFSAWMAAPMNNAKLLPFGLYDHWEPAFAEMFRRQHHDWPAFYRAVKALSRQPTKVRKAQMQALLNAYTHQTTPTPNGQ